MNVHFKKKILQSLNKQTKKRDNFYKGTNLHLHEPSLYVVKCGCMESEELISLLLLLL